MKDYINARDNAKNKRNKIELHFKKINEDNIEIPNTRSQIVDIKTVGEYIFDKLRINPYDVLELDFNAGKDRKQVSLKPGVDSEKYAGQFPDTFKGYQVTVTKLPLNKTRVLFKFVPTEVPDEDIINLCNAYVTLESKVEKQTIEIPVVKLKSPQPTDTYT